MLRINMLCVYRVGFVLLVLASVSVQDNMKKKMVSKVEDEGLGDEIARNRRDFRKSDLRIGMFTPLICEELRRRKLRNGRDVKNNTRRTQLGFFTEIHCRRLHHWLNHGKGYYHGHRMRDCQDVQRYYGKRWSKSDAYVIHPKGGKSIKVYCDMKTDGGGWTVFQHRSDGSVNFYRAWNEYKSGFGNVNKEFWLGNDNLHRITNQGKYKLRIEMEDYSGNKRYAEYSSFSVADENRKYRLSIGSYSGTAGNSLAHSNNRYFSTKDRDNDNWAKHCAKTYNSGWWHGVCTNTNLNGLYSSSKNTDGKYNFWYHWPGGLSNIKISTMMIRKV